MRAAIVAVAVALCLGGSVGPLTAQSETRRVVVGGEVGTFLETYGISGAERRRPTATGRLYLRPSLLLYGRYTVAFDIMLTTEGRAFQGDARQRLNQYSINPDWGWGSASLGDFTDEYTPLTFSGIRVRGAGSEVRRGPVTFSTFGGRTQRASRGGAVSGSYDRTVTGGRFEIGDVDGASFAVTVVRASDDVGSLDLPSDTVFPEIQPDTLFAEDTLQIGIDNEFAVTPQENVVAGVNGSLGLFGETVRLRGELAGSAYSRDLRSDPIQDAETLERIPSVPEWLFTPRASSSGDYAYTLEAEVRPLAALSTTVSFHNVGAGYVSLGTAGVMSDRRDLTVRNAYRRGRFQARLDVGRQRDNLLGQKNVTSKRDRLVAAVTMRPLQRWSVSARLQRATLHNDASEPDRWIDYVSWVAGLRQSWAVGRRGPLRSVSLDYTYRPTDDANPLRSSSESRSHSANASLMLSPSRSVSITPTVGVVHSRFAEAGWTTRSTYGIGTQLARANGRWVSSLNLARSQFQQTAALQATLTSRLQITQRDALILTGRAADYDNLVDSSLAFSEMMASIRWSHRF